MALRLDPANDLVRVAEGDEVEPCEEDRGEQDDRPDRLTEGSPDPVTATDDRDADPQRGPNSERQPVRPPSLHDRAVRLGPAETGSSGSGAAAADRAATTA